MNVKEAAISLLERIGDAAFISAVDYGQLDGKDVLFVYTRSKSVCLSEWEGFPVVVKKIGIVKPARR